MKTGKWIALLFAQTVFAEIATIPTKDIEEGVSYAYPFSFHEDADFLDEERSEKEAKTASKDTSPPAWHGKLGNATVNVDVENTDFLSQCQAEWEKKHKKEPPKRKKRSSFDKEEENKKEDHSPQVKFSIKWGKDP